MRAGLWVFFFSFPLLYFFLGILCSLHYHYRVCGTMPSAQKDFNKYLLNKWMEYVLVSKVVS